MVGRLSRSIPIAPLHLVLLYGPCCAACEPSMLWVIESSCSCWAEVRVLQSAPRPRTEHTGIPLPHLTPQHETRLSRSLHSGPAPNKPPFFLSPSPGTLSVPSSQSLISLSETDFTKRLCPTAFTSSSFYFYLKKTRRPSQPGSRLLEVY